MQRSHAPASLRDASLSLQYQHTRALTEKLIEPLLPEDMTVQAMPDASPTKWHLAHTSWFFETFLLVPYAPGYRPFNEAYDVLFNSYYQAIGPQFTRARRGLLTRPPLTEIRDYRRWVDLHMAPLLARAQSDEGVASLVALGISHEQQHQELILTDIKYLLASNPLYPAYRPALCSRDEAPPCRWVSFAENIYSIGVDEGFAFDNEGPRHKVYLTPFSLASRPVTNGEYLAFMEAEGYRQPHHWLAEGWDTVVREGWQAPLYWVRQEDGWYEYTLSGLRPLSLAEPVCHVSYYEAQAYASWYGKRLPTEAEWEVAVQQQELTGHFLDMDRLHPLPAAGEGVTQLFGDVWEWTASAYIPYPGYHLPSGAIGEYNGKFMCGQMVLRGGSCVTPPGHVRASYRNYFPPGARWQFSGIRLAADTEAG